MAEQDSPSPTLTPGAERLVELAQQKQRLAKHPQLGVHHWLAALLERHGSMAEALVKGLEATSLGQYVQNQLAQGNKET